MKSVEMLGIVIHPLTMAETVEAVDGYIKQKKPLHLMGVNADKINLCYDDERIKDIVNSSGIVNADGASVVLAGKFLGVDIPERVAGIDLMQELLVLAENQKYSVYFLGAKQEILDNMLVNFKERFPKLRVIGSRNGYFSDELLNEIENEIRLLSPDIVFIGITSPKKEYIVDQFLSNGLSSVFMGVGGSFDVLSGHIKRAPIWMQKYNLEWLYRVANEPKRLFKRYFVGNMIFISRVIKEKIKNVN